MADNPAHGQRQIGCGNDARIARPYHIAENRKNAAHEFRIRKRFFGARSGRAWLAGNRKIIFALWLNALWIGSQFHESWKEPLARGLESFHRRFWNAAGGYLFDVADADHESGKLDATFRPNQIFAVGGLPLQLIEGEQAKQIVNIIERRLWTPLGLRSLAPEESRYTPRYEGGVRERDGAYHQGIVWPWLIGPFVEAWLRVRGNTSRAKHEARQRFLPPLFDHLDHAGLGHVSEIADAEPPHRPRGCPFQAWSLAELIRLDRVVLAKKNR